ncbi:MAG: nucleotide exchange factor GrpE [Bacteroidia bacterium]|nr:nucleotide exchange factor GrpE [Bacteroidia bacterium]
MQNQEDNLKADHTEEQQMNKETDIKAENDDLTAETTAAEQSNESLVKELNDKYLRLYSEFDNYRKRTIKEKSEIIKTAGEDVFKAILPIIDDFERAVKANENVDDSAAIKEGMVLIYNKLKNISQQKGLVALESIGEVFNPDLMEAITNIPATDDSQKGKVIDEVEKGYKLGDKVIRFAKVVIAQ